MSSIKSTKVLFFTNTSSPPQNFAVNYFYISLFQTISRTPIEIKHICCCTQSECNQPNNLPPIVHYDNLKSNFDFNLLYTQSVISFEKLNFEPFIHLKRFIIISCDVDNLFLRPSIKTSIAFHRLQ